MAAQCRQRIYEPSEVDAARSVGKLPLPLLTLMDKHEDPARDAYHLEALEVIAAARAVFAPKRRLRRGTRLREHGRDSPLTSLLTLGVSSPR